LYTARLHDDTPVLVYLLLEHKSYIDRHIALQLLGYVLRILEWRKRNGQPPCVVIPIVIYHGDEPWDEPTSLRDKIAANEHLTAFVPENDSLNDARNDIIWYLCAVFDAGKLEWFAQVIRTGLQLEPETPMPTIYEALIERGVVQGIEKGIEKGVIIGRIRTLQEVLQQPVASQEELVSLSHDELQQRAQQLQGLLRDRPA